MGLRCQSRNPLQDIHVLPVSRSLFRSIQPTQVFYSTSTKSLAVSVLPHNNFKPPQILEERNGDQSGANR